MGPGYNNSKVMERHRGIGEDLHRGHGTETEQLDLRM